jgi:hypothetical protein
VTALVDASMCDVIVPRSVIEEDLGAGINKIKGTSDSPSICMYVKRDYTTERC